MKLVTDTDITTIIEVGDLDISDLESHKVLCAANRDGKIITIYKRVEGQDENVETDKT